MTVWRDVILIERYAKSRHHFQDTTEVDTNVTRHLDRRLDHGHADGQWDALILHYLGVDHIGHLQGPAR